MTKENIRANGNQMLKNNKLSYEQKMKLQFPSNDFYRDNYDNQFHHGDKVEVVHDFGTGPR
jgi:hypothetical protein